MQAITDEKIENDVEMKAGHSFRGFKLRRYM